MFEIVNEENFVTVKYSAEHKKWLIEVFLGVCALLLVCWAVMLFKIASVEISMILALALVGWLIVFFVKYSDIKSFSLIISENGITFNCKKQKIEAQWNEIKSCGIITRTGSESIEDTITNSFGSVETNKKNTFYFTKTEKPKLKKLVYQVRTTAIVDHGIVKEMCYISEYRGTQLFSVILDTFDKFNSNPELTCITQDRNNIK